MYFVQKDDLPLSWYLVKAAETDSEITYNVTVGLEHSNRLSESVVLYKTGQIQDLALVKFHKMDSWFEEDEEIFIHPRDPYKVCAHTSTALIGSQHFKSYRGLTYFSPPDTFESKLTV